MQAMDDFFFLELMTLLQMAMEKGEISINLFQGCKKVRLYCVHATLTCELQQYSIIKLFTRVGKPRLPSSTTCAHKCVERGRIHEFETKELSPELPVGLQFDREYANKVLRSTPPKNNYISVSLDLI